MATLGSRILTYLAEEKIYTDNIPDTRLRAHRNVIQAELEELVDQGRVIKRDAFSRGGGTCTVYELS